MTPKGLTNEMLVGWGGSEVFTQAMATSATRAKARVFFIVHK